MPQNANILILAAGLMLAVLAGIAAFSNYHSLNIKARTVGHGQHGTARWATNREIIRTYTHVNFAPALWREGKNLPKEQAMASVMSTALARLNSFLDSEMEQILCFGTTVDAETFCNEKSALFLVMPEEDPSATRS